MSHVLARRVWPAALAIGIASAGRASVVGAQPMAVPSAVAQARADSARYPYTAADIRFMTMMIGHHSQAITISRMAPTHGASPAVQRLAARIINAQQDEIGTMQRWLRDRRQPVPPAATDSAAHSAMDHGAMNHTAMNQGEMDHASMDHAAMDHGATDHAAMDHGAMDGMRMPGMLSAAQVAQLDRARGETFDRLFLTFMMEHHRGAVSMVDALFASYGAGQDETVFKFASDVHVDQTTEIARMQQMLADILLGTS